MSLRTLVGLSIWPALFLLVFAFSLRLLPAWPVMAVILPERAFSANFSPDAALLMTQSSNDVGQADVRFWRVPNGEEEAFGVAATERYVEFLPNGRLLLQRRYSVSDNHCQLTFKEFSTGKEWLTVQSSDWFGGCMSRDGSTLAVINTDSGKHEVEIWNIMRRCRTAALVACSPVALSPDGKILVYQAECGPVANNAPLLVFMDLASRRELGRIKMFDWTNSAPFAEFSPDGKLVAVRYPTPEKWNFQLIDMGTFKPIAIPELGPFAFAQGGAVLFAIEWANAGKIHYWDVRTGDEGEIPLQGFQFGPGLFESSPDGRFLAVEAISPPHPLAAYMSYLPSWEWLLNLCAGPQEEFSTCTVLLFDVKTRRPLASFPKRGISPQPFSSDGSLLALVSQDGRVEVCNVPPRKPIWLAASLAAAFVGVVWAVRFGYRRFRRLMPLSRRPIAT
jgi:WD40 repeat protein